MTTDQLKQNPGDVLAGIHEERRPFAVVAGIDINGLGVVRSLAKAAVPTIVVDTDLSKPTARTRFGRKIRVSSLSGRPFVDELLNLAGHLRELPALFLTREDSVETALSAQRELKTRYRFTMPTASIMEALLDKAQFQQLAEKLHYPVPRAVRVHGADIAEVLARLRFPCAIKPVRKDAAYSARFKKAYRLETISEALELWSQMKDVAEEAIVQEWIDGGDSDVYFCLQYRPAVGDGVVSFVGRKLSQWPPLVGGTACCIPAPEVQNELIALTNSFFNDVGFVGLGSMEYKQDVRDKKFYMVEPTVGRTDYQEEVATLNGVNIPYAAYMGETGKMVVEGARTARPCAWQDTDAFKNALIAGSPNRLPAVLPYANIIDACWRLDDPGPFLHMKFNAVQRRLGFSRPARQNV